MPWARFPAIPVGTGRLALSEAEDVPIRVSEPRATYRTELRDVAGRLEWPFGIVEERDAPGLEVADRGLDVGHLEMATGVSQRKVKPSVSP